MPAGTIALLNNSTAVTGTGTAFTSELNANDFIVVTVGGVTYTLGIESIASDTSMTLVKKFDGPTTTGLAWTALPAAAMVLMSAQTAADVAKFVRAANYDKINWQQVYSELGDITITLLDGSQFSGPSWRKIVNLLADLDIDNITLIADRIHADSVQVAADKPVIVQAKADAVAANTAAQQAKTDAVSASSTAVQAGTTATNQADRAKAEADRAAASNPANSLLKVSNLSDLSDKEQARNNLTVYSKAETDSKILPVGTTAGTLAAGNDARLGTIDNKTGGTVTGNFSVNGLITANTTGVGAGGSFYANGNFQSGNFRWGGMLVSQAPAAWGNSAAGGRIRTEIYVRDNVGVISDTVFSSMLFGGRRDFGIDNNGSMWGPNGTIQQNASDIRLKTDINPAQNGAKERIKKLGSVEFTWIDSGKKERGWIAQQAETVDPLYVELGRAQQDRDFNVMSVKDRAILADVVTCLGEVLNALDEQKTLNADLLLRIEKLESNASTPKT